MDTRTKQWLLIAGAAGAVLGTSLLAWVSVDVFFTTVTASAWRAGGLGPLAGVLALALLSGAVFTAITGSPVRIPPLALVAAAAGLGFIATAVLLSGQAAAGTFVTLFSTAVSGYAALSLSGQVLPVSGAASPVTRTAPLNDSAGASQVGFCPKCGTALDGGARFCAACGTRVP